MRVLILGGSGFLGKTLTRRLLNQKIPVSVLDCISSLSELQSEPLLQFHKGNFADSDTLQRAMHGCNIIYHLIGTTTPFSSNIDPERDIQENLIATVKMLQMAKKSEVEKIIFISSGGTVYGLPHYLPVDENHPVNPICSYGITKLSIEKYLYMYYQDNGPDYTILRLANPYGCHQNPKRKQGIIPIWMQKVLKKEPVEIWGDGTVVRDYVYIDDAIDAMVSAI
jgi:UDP-glucose 4-epimerase